MKTIWLAAVLVAAMMTAGVAEAAKANRVCMPSVRLLMMMDAKGHAAAVTFKNRGVGMVTAFVNPKTKRWALVMSNSNGFSCIFLAGKGEMNLHKVTPGVPL